MSTNGKQAGVTKPNSPAGENGKTTVLVAVTKTLSHDIAVTVSDRILTARPGDHPTELMSLRGARLAFREEFPELGHLNAKRLKTVVGTERIVARHGWPDA